MSGDDKRVEEMLDYMKDAVLHPERHPEHWEDWLRADRQRFLLLNIIYYIQHVQGKEEGITREDLEIFLGELYYVDGEMFSNIIKPWKSEISGRHSAGTFGTGIDPPDA